MTRPATRKGQAAVRRRADLLARLDALLSEIGGARLPRLRELWREHLDEALPALRSPQIFRRMLAWRLQAVAHGGLSAVARRKLDEIEAKRLGGGAPKAPAPLTRLDPGVVLTREWKGVRHRIEVTSDGFKHNGRTFNSLSEIARSITGTRWNGPRFFGLREKVGPDGEEACRCAIYTRKSTEEGLEQGFNSLDAQREACEAYILSQASEGWTARPDRYDDGGFSGGNDGAPCPASGCWRTSSAGRVDVVVVYKVDRLTRSLSDFAKHRRDVRRRRASRSSRSPRRSTRRPAWGG